MKGYVNEPRSPKAPEKEQTRSLSYHDVRMRNEEAMRESPSTQGMLRQDWRAKGERSSKKLRAGAAAGQAEVSTCAICGRRNGGHVRFCPHCGSRVSATRERVVRPRLRHVSSTRSLSAALVAVLALEIIGVAWGFYNPWAGGGGGGAAVAPVANQSPAEGTPSQSYQPASSLVSDSDTSLERSTFSDYGVTLFFPHGWRAVPASSGGSSAPDGGSPQDRDRDLLATYLPPSGDGAVMVFADSQPAPELRQFEVSLHGEMVLRGFSGLGLPEVRLRGCTLAGRQGLVSEVIEVPGRGAATAALIIGSERIYYFALVGEDRAALTRVMAAYWPALQSTQCSVGR